MASEDGADFGHLPAELWTMVLAHCDDHALPILARTSTQWRAVVKARKRNPKHECALRCSLPSQKERNRRAYLNRAIHQGHIRLVVWLCEQEGFEPDASACKKAARAGDLDILQWLRLKGCPWNAGVCFSATKGGHLRLLEWARGVGCPWSEWATANAAQRGDVDMLTWLDRNGCPLHPRTTDIAARHGHLGAMQWLVQQGVRPDWGTADAAARGGHLGIIQWLNEQGFKTYILWAGESAIESGRPDLIDWLDTVGVRWDTGCCQAAAERGDIKLLERAQARGAQFDASTCMAAARGNHLETLMWLRAQGCPWTHWTWYHALCAGNLDMIRWLYDEGCPRTHADAVQAAYSGNLDVVEWAYRKVLLYGSYRRVAMLAIDRSHLHIVRWLVERGYRPDAQVFVAIAVRNEPQHLNWLWNRGWRIDMTSAFRNAVPRSHLETMRWLRDHGYKWNERDCLLAAASCSIESFEWMRAGGCPWSREACLAAASATHHTAIE